MSRFRRPLTRFLLLLAACSLALVLSSCRGKERSFASPYGKELLSQEAFAVRDRAGLVAALSQRTEPMEELWVRFGTTIRQEGNRVAPSFTTIAMYRAPESIMLGISRFELGTIFSILIEGESVSFYANRERRMFVGTLDELAEKTALIGGLPPRDLVAAVTIQRDLYEALTSGRPVTVLDQGSHLLVAARHATTRRQYFWLVRKADALVQEVLIRTPDGIEETRVHYQEYGLFENAATGSRHPYPARLTLRVPAQEITVDADVKEYRLGTELPPFRLPRARETYPLSTLNFDGAP